MKSTLVLIFLLASFVVLASATVYFKEDFDDADDLEKNWVVSTYKGSEAGKFELSSGKFNGKKEAARGLRTTQDARFYQISAKITEFSNKGKDLVLQYSVKHEQKIDCGGGYIKLLPAGLKQGTFNGDSDYNIMFGPDICGTSTHKVHVIFNYKGKNHLINKDIPCKTDELTHLYTLIVHPDQTYQVLIDNEDVAHGNLVEDWDFLPPKQIPDPKASKPTDWVDEKEIPDPADKKPEGYDDIPAQIPDTEAKKPEDWDDELDGEWEPPKIDNPEYEGPWEPRTIPNPAYKGEWIHPKVDNPDFKADDSLYAFDSHAFLGIEVWQVKAGTIFDNFLVTDSVDEASDAAREVLKEMKAEKKKFDAHAEEEKKKAEEERKKAEAEKAAKDASEEEEEEEEEEDSPKSKDEL